MSRVLGAALAIAATFPSPISATDIYIGVESRGANRPQWVIGLAPFFAENPKRSEDADIGRRLRQVVRSDLLFSRYFELIEQGPPADVTNPGKIRASWAKRGAGFLLEATASLIRTQVTLSVKLTDLASGEVMISRYYRQGSRFWRQIAHQVADDIVGQMTGRRGIAGTRIAFVNDKTGNKELYLVDYDGARLKRITANGSINLFPRWSPKGNKLAFTSYKDGNPDLFLYDLSRGRIEPLSSRQGLNISGGFAPDGSAVALTLSKGKDPKVFILDLKKRKARRATSHWGVESSPTFSPGGEHLAFVSDRAGNPQIHTMELATGRTRRLTKLNWCDSPAWSPTGEWIAFAGRANPKDSFDIFLVDVTGTKVVQLTHGEGTNEEPAWSPDGRFLIFATTREIGKRKLYLMDADGSAPRPLGDIPGRSFTPSWSG